MKENVIYPEDFIPQGFFSIGHERIEFNVFDEEPIVRMNYDGELYQFPLAYIVELINKNLEEDNKMN